MKYTYDKDSLTACENYYRDAITRKPKKYDLTYMRSIYLRHICGLEKALKAKQEIIDLQYRSIK